MDMYGWYSEKQFGVLKKRSEVNTSDRPYIYYEDRSGNIVQITEVTNDINFKSRFDDVKSLGIMKKFHMASKEPISSSENV